MKLSFISRLKKMEQDIDGEERARGQLTGELRIKKTQHMTTSRWWHDTWHMTTSRWWHDMTQDTGDTRDDMTWHTRESNQFWILSFRRFVEVMTEYNRIQVQFTCSHSFCHFHCFVLPIPFFRDIFFWSDFLQVEYREQSKNKIKRQLEIAGKQATDEELEQMLEVSRYSLSSIRTIEKMKYFYQSC